jgi:hypothetical protein
MSDQVCDCASISILPVLSNLHLEEHARWPILCSLTHTGVLDTQDPGLVGKDTSPHDNILQQPRHPSDTYLGLTPIIRSRCFQNKDPWLGFFCPKVADHVRRWALLYT